MAFPRRVWEREEILSFSTPPPMLRFTLLLLLGNLTACSHLAYYSQAISGQWEVFRRSQPISEVLTDPATVTSLKQQLTDILSIRTFATRMLHLPDNRSYTYYADLHRPFVVWNVFAAPPFSLQPESWCFPILGCVHYRGYFASADAQTLAKELRTQGYDVYVAGITAYSTLGWFTDPVLNTMLKWELPQIAGTIFHELAHQQLYIPDDTAFNEAFAMTVEYEGVKRWLTHIATPQISADYQQSQPQQLAFIQLVLATRDQLQQVYQKPLSPTAMQREKAMAFETMRAHYADLKKQWHGYAGYDNWFASDLNNAKLLSVITYQDYVPAFQALLIQQGGDLPKFYAVAARIGELPSEQRRAKLQELVRSSLKREDKER